MMALMRNLNINLRRLHRWLGYAIGAQLLIWLISGLFMVWFPIDEVRGSHLRSETAAPVLIWPVDALPPQALSGHVPHDIQSAEARLLAGQPVWLVRGLDEETLLDARSGATLSPVSEARARDLASAAYEGRGALRSAHWHDIAPREAGLDGPAWQIGFGPEDKADLYINARTGELRAVRTDLWRAFDFFWGLHIMDWSSRENFNSWWIKMTATLGLLFALAGTGLLILRLAMRLRSFR